MDPIRGSNPIPYHLRGDVLQIEEFEWEKLHIPGPLSMNAFASDMYLYIKTHILVARLMHQLL